jgi:hypothetical protein
MKNNNRIFDLTQPNASTLLDRHYRKYSYGGTTRYKCKAFEFLVDEFHPYWHTYRVGDTYCEMKVEIQSFDVNTGQRESCDSIWFDVKATNTYVEAVCQLSSDIRFLIMGSKASLEARQIEDDETVVC